MLANAIHHGAVTSCMHGQLCVWSRYGNPRKSPQRRLQRVVTLKCPQNPLKHRPTAFVRVRQ